MRVLTLPAEERKKLIVLAKQVKDAKTAVKIRIILGLDAGYSVKEVAEILLVDEDTVSKCKKKYEKRQFWTDWLADAYKGYSGKLTKEQETEIDTYVQRETITDCKQIVAYIRTKYSLNYTITGVTKLLHRLGFVYKQVVLVPGKLNVEAQKTFIKKYEQMQEKKSDDEIILFGDGVHPSHNIHKTKAWIKKGEEKQIKTNTGRKRLNINGVFDPDTFEVTVHYSKTINAEEVIIFFDKLQERYKGKKIKIIVDNAPYYKNKDVQAYLARKDCRIELIFLPSYSPNLNFIERLWKFMKKYIIGVTYRETFKEFEYDIKQFFENINQYENKLRPFIGTQLHLLQVKA